MEAKNVNEMTTSELKEALKKKEQEERVKLERERKSYEKKRDDTITRMIGRATTISGELEGFKESCHQMMEAQKECLESYGLIRSNSKGGFGISNIDGDMKVVRRRDTDPTWDERSEKAVNLVKEFLCDTVKKRDQKLFEILFDFLQKNKNGEMEYSKVMNLIKHESKFSDNRWLEGLRLLKQSFSNQFKSYSYEFKTREEGGQWHTITLNFSSI